MPSLRHYGAVAALPLVAAATAWGHTGEAIEPHDLWTAWEFDPGVVIPLAVSAWLYWRGSRPLWNGTRPGRGIRKWEAAAFWSGWLTLLVALCSPIHPLGEVLFAAHMVQHELIIVVAAPLMVLGRPIVAFLWGLPMNWRRAAGRWSKATPVQAVWQWLARPAVATVLAGFTLWLWHAPALYQATLTNDAVHSAQHLAFLSTSLLFWWALLRGPGGHVAHGEAVFWVFATFLHSSILGAMFTFANGLVYPAYNSAAVAAWGFTPLQDQINAGLIMWIPAGVVYIVAALALCAECLGESDRHADNWLAVLRQHAEKDAVL